MKCFQCINGRWVFLCDVVGIDSVICTSTGSIEILKTDGGVVYTDVYHGPIRIGD